MQQVHSGMLDMLEYFQKGEDGKERLADMVKEVTGATPLFRHPACEFTITK